MSTLDLGDIDLDPAMDPLSSVAAGKSKEQLQDALLEGSKLPINPASRVDKDTSQAAKQSYITHSGNVAAVSRDTGLTPRVVHALAADHDWPLYGDGDTKGDKSTKTRLRRLHSKLEEQLFDLLDSLSVETKQKDDLVEKGLESEYVASLSQRSGAFKQVFDSYCKVGSMIAPETFDTGAVDAHGVRAQTGGLSGADRDLADFVARVAVGVADQTRRIGSGEIIEAEVVGD